MVIASRLPFVAGMLFEWDSALYASAVEHGFHVDTEIAAERPHPPGYLFYLALARAMRFVTGDSNAALVAVAVLASGAATAALYVLARRWTTRSVAAAAALAFAASPLAWRYSEVALPYTLLALLTTLLALLFLDVRARRMSPVVATFVFGVVAGFRQDVLLLMGPLWVWALATASSRERVVALVAGAAGVLTWLVPSALLSDGIVAYLAAVLRQTAHVTSTTSAAEQGASGLTQNAALTVYALAWGVAFLAVALIAGAARLVATRRVADATFFLLWIVPGLAVYVLLHIGEPAYVLSLLPAVYVIGARAVAGALRQRAAGALTAVALANAVLFLAAPGPFSAGTIAMHDRALARAVTATRDAFAPERSSLVAQFDYALARYYLPEYRTYFVGDAPEALSRAARRVELDPRGTRVAVFGAVARLPHGAERVLIPGADPSEVAILMADAGETLAVFDVEPR